jgi:endo-1,4-beta-xylanase
MAILALLIAMTSFLTTDGIGSLADATRADLPGEPALLHDPALPGTLALLDSTLAQARPVEVEGQPFDTATRVEVKALGETGYAVQFQSPPMTQPLPAGHRVAVVMWVRAIESRDESGEGRFLARLQMTETPWTAPAEGTVSVGREWKRIVVGGVAEGAYPAGSLLVTTHLSVEVQTLEIGPILAFDLGPDADLSKLPVTPVSYPGREPEAAWRSAAAERIERIRKGDLAVRVIDRQGVAVPGAEVEVRMTRHAFGFGCFAEEPMVQQGEDADRYRAEFERLFNTGTCPIYWADWGWEAADQRDKYLARAQWLREKRMRVRGHTVIWPGWQWMPSRIRGLADDPAVLRAALDARVRDVLASTAPFGWEAYDLVNEPRFNRDIMDILGDDVMQSWWHLAERVHPGPRYFLNDYAILTNGGRNEREVAAYHAWIRRLLDADAPLGGIGFQGHFGNALTDPARVYEILDDFAQYGLPIHVTEFDIDTRDTAAQADYTRDFLTIAFSHEAVEMVVFWGFWEQVQWRPDGAMFRSDWSPKPNLDAYERLVLDEWWTDERVETDAEGRATVRGFCGDYVVEVSQGDRRAATTVRLERRGANLLVVLGDE